MCLLCFISDIPDEGRSSDDWGWKQRSVPGFVPGKQHTGPLILRPINTGLHLFYNPLF